MYYNHNDISPFVENLMPQKMNKCGGGNDNLRRNENVLSNAYPNRFRALSITLIAGHFFHLFQKISFQLNII